MSRFLWFTVYKVPVYLWATKFVTVVGISSAGFSSDLKLHQKFTEPHAIIIKAKICNLVSPLSCSLFNLRICLNAALNARPNYCFFFCGGIANKKSWVSHSALAVYCVHWQCFFWWSELFSVDFFHFRVFVVLSYLLTYRGDNFEDKMFVCIRPMYTRTATKRGIYASPPPPRDTTS